MVAAGNCLMAIFHHEISYDGTAHSLCVGKNGKNVNKIYLKIV